MGHQGATGDVTAVDPILESTQLAALRSCLGQLSGLAIEGRHYLYVNLTGVGARYITSVRMAYLVPAVTRHPSWRILC